MTEPAFDELLRRLSKAGVEFIVAVGGKLLTSSAIRTFPRTGDKTLVRTSLGEVDVLQGLPQIPKYEELALSAEDAEYEGVQVKVCSLADLRAMKRAADRGQDRFDLEALEIAHPEDPEDRLPHQLRRN